MDCVWGEPVLAVVVVVWGRGCGKYRGLVICEWGVLVLGWGWVGGGSRWCADDVCVFLPVVEPKGVPVDFFVFFLIIGKSFWGKVPLGLGKGRRGGGGMFWEWDGLEWVGSWRGVRGGSGGTGISRTVCG